MSDDPLAGIKSPKGYEILSVLGRGGMGVVVKARETRSRNLVALKYLHRVDNDVRERFMREARLGTELHHPNIITGRGVEFVDDAPVVVFDFFESTDLSAIIRRETRLPQARAVGLIVQILAGLDHAHRAGVVHRDLKSANVLISQDGVARLADFGVAHLRDAQEKLTRTGAVLGTPAYMAPEQAEGGKIDERTDIYAAGVILFEMITGTYPIQGVSPIDMLTRVRVDVPLRLTDIVPEADLRLTEIVARCLEKKPEDRYPSAEALLRAIDPNAQLAENQQATLPDSPEGWSPASGPTVDAAQTLTRPNRSTGRVRVLSGSIPVPGNLGAAGAPVRSGVSRPTGKSAALSKASLSDTIGGQVQASTSQTKQWAWAAVAALCVIAIGAAALRKKPSTPDPEATVAVARPLTIMNAADSACLATVGDRLVFAFETDPPDELRAVVTSGTGQQSLTRVPGASSGSRQVFEAPAALLLEAFSVRFARVDGAPLSNGVYNHPGLLSIVDGWREKLKLDARGEVAGAPPGPRWAQQLDALERALGGSSSDAFVKISGSTARMDDVAAGSRARDIARRAKKVLGPLLAAAPALLDLPDDVLPLERRRLVYDALVPFRLVDRVLIATRQPTELVKAEPACGTRFRAGPAATEPARGVTKDTKAIRLVSWGTARKDIENQEAIMGAVFKHEAKLLDAWPISLEIAPGTGPARVDVLCRRSQGNQEPMVDDDVLWVALPDRGWRLLITRANVAPFVPRLKNHQRLDGLYVHHIDPALLDTTTRFTLTREVLPSDRKQITADRRGVPLHIFQLAIRRD